MNGSWQDQSQGLGSTGWMPLYMAAQGYGLPPGQSAAPQQGQAPMGPSPLGQMSPVQNTGGPDFTGNMPGGGYAFDNSGSDAGVGGQPVNQMQTPWQQPAPNFGQNSFRPPMLSDFRQGAGRQIQGNPTSQFIGGGGIGSIGLGSLGSGSVQQR